MKLTVIDTNTEFSKEIYKRLGNSYNDNKLSLRKKKVDKNGELVKDEEGNGITDLKDCSEIAQTIVETYKAEISLNEKENKDDNRLHIFINIEGEFKGKRQEQKGVEILMWLRCKYRACNPVILYSFQSSHQLLKQKPENLIINSEGCYFFQLPYDFEKLRAKKFDGVKDWNSLKKFLKPAFNIEEFRHREANWWGILMLWRVVTRVQSIKGTPASILNIKSKFDDLNNTIGRFLYEYEDTNLNKVIQYNKYLLPIGEFTYEKMNTGNKWINEKRFLYQDEEVTFHKRISDLQRYLSKERSPKIFYIDDQANDGWQDVFQSMIYGEKENNNFQVLNFNSAFQSTDNIDEKIDNIFSKLIEDLNLLNQNNSFNVDVFLLDIRLLPKYDENYANDIKNMSGPRMLNKIRIKYPGVPIIITTASNKIWTYEEIMKLGSDAYWVKEGLDEQKAAKESAENYITFLELVLKTTGKRYSVLKLLSEKIESFSNSTSNYWWLKERTWTNGDITGATTKEAIVSILGEVQKALRIYLHQSVMDYGYQAKEIQPFWLCAIVNKLAGIIEEIHFPGKPGFESSQVGGVWSKDKTDGKWKWRTKKREDWAAQIILLTRNAASHYKLGSILDDFEILKKVTQLLLSYLESDVFEQLNEPDYFNFNINWELILRTIQEFINKNNIDLPA